MSQTVLQNIRTVLQRASEKWGDKTAFIFDETNEQFTFREVEENVKTYAAVLVSLGVNQRDRVAIMLPNIPDFPFTWLATGVIGAITVPLNYRYQQFDANYVIEHSESRLVITTAEKVPMLHQLREQGNLPLQIVTVDEPHHLAGHFLPALLKQVEIPNLSDTIYAEDIMNIQYTSGTTGKPKGCILPQFYWMNIANKIADPSLIGINESDITLTSQPFYYMDPQWNTMATLVNGATLVILDRFSPSVFWEKIRHYQVTFFYVLGNMPVLLLKMPVTSKEKDHKVRFIGCSAIPSQIHRKIEERWGVKWHEVFGMTETGYDISMRSAEHHAYIGTNAIGRGTHDREVQVMDDQGQFVPRGEIGELVFRGTGMMYGYFKNEEATKAIFQHGWFHTGDLAYMDEKGVIFYVGRKKDMIRRSGENIAAAEVEEVIMLNDQIEIAACTPVDDETRGEEIKAHLITKGAIENMTAFIQQLILHCEQNLAAFKVPRYWEIREDFPITPSERIAKHQLKESTYPYYDRNTKSWSK